MNPGNHTHRRWQFSLGALFGALTVAALLLAAMTGAFGTVVRDNTMGALTILLVIGAGICYYALFILLLCSPVLLVVGAIRLIRRMTARPRVMPQTNALPSPADQDTLD